MPLFAWGDRHTARLILSIVGAHEMDVEVARQETRRAVREDADRLRLARTRWLEENHAERSFPSGVVPDPHEVETGQPPLNVLPAERTTIQVTAAVLPTDVVFLRDGSEEVVEVGRIPRTAISGVDVLDKSGAHVPEPIHETIEPPQLSLLVLRWTSAGVEDEDRFAFRSPWLAWHAARWLMEARRS